MSADDIATANFASGVVTLSKLLAKDGRTVYEVQYDYLAFGNWLLIAGTRHNRLRLVWDGKESYLEVFVASFSSSATIANWKLVSGAIPNSPNGDLSQDLVASIAQFVVAHT